MIRPAGVIALVIALGCGGGETGDAKVPAGAARPSDTMTVDAVASAPAAPLPAPSIPADSSPSMAPMMKVSRAPLDSIVNLVPDLTSPAPPAVVVRMPVDTASVVATRDELASLAAELIIPVQGVVASQLRDSYTAARTGHTHEALDIMAARGTPVLSATDGRLLKLYSSVAGGTMVYAADASDRFILMYGHLDRYADGLTEKMVVKRGQVIGYVGSTGNASEAAPHLHFAIARGHPSAAWWKGTPVNPYPLLARPLAPSPRVIQNH